MGNEPNVFVPLKWETTKGMQHYINKFLEDYRDLPKTEDANFEVVSATALVEGKENPEPSVARMLNSSNEPDPQTQ